MFRIYEKQFSKIFDISNSMSTDSQLIMQGFQDPNEDFNVKNIWNTLFGEESKTLKGKGINIL